MAWLLDWIPTLILAVWFGIGVARDSRRFGLGILLDTFVVRTLVIPAVFTLVGRRVWWPSPLAQVRDDAPASGRAVAGPEVSGAAPARS